MIGLFKKKYFKVLQLYKIVDSEKDDVILAKNCALLISNFFLEYFGEYPNHYTLDYSNEYWKTNKGFKSALQKKENQDLMYVWQGISTKRKTDNHAVLSNPFKNFSKKPKKYAVNLELVLTKEKFDLNKVNSFLKEFYNVLSYDYCFMQELDDTYDFSSGNKRNINGKENVLHDVFYVWQKRVVAIQYGCLVNVFEINYLNSSQMDRPEIKSYLERGLGTFECLNKYITIWKLSLAERNQVQKELSETEILMAVDPSRNKFLKTEDAKKFKEWMDYD